MPTDVIRDRLLNLLGRGAHLVDVLPAEGEGAEWAGKVTS